MMARLRSDCMFGWQPNHCDIIDNDYWIPHGQGLSWRSIMDTDPQRNRGPRDADVGTPGVLLSVDDIDTLRSCTGAAREDEKTMPWHIANCKLHVLAFLKSNVKAIRRVIGWHDAMFNLSRHYPMPAYPYIDKVYFLEVPTADLRPLNIETGVDSEIALEQLQAITAKVFKD